MSAALAAIALGMATTTGHAQELEKVTTVFESLSHRHAGSAFIYAHVLSGAVRSQVGDEPAKVYQGGEGFYELPGSHHRVSENASTTQPASLLAVFIVDTKDTPLTKPDQN